MNRFLAAFLVLTLGLVVTGADKGKSPQVERSATSPQAVPVVKRPIEEVPSDLPAVVSSEAPSDNELAGDRAAAFVLKRVSVNSGGVIGGVSGPMRAGVSAGQSVAGLGSTADQTLRAGFWYSASSGCPISMTGDANANGLVNATDAIVLVNYVFRAGPSPEPCPATGDVNCSGLVNATDIIFLVNYVFRAGPPPCDACTLIPDVYSCP